MTRGDPSTLAHPRYSPRIGVLHTVVLQLLVVIVVVHVLDVISD